jgi:polyisoprenoid-binding protein YceI
VSRSLAVALLSVIGSALPTAAQPAFSADDHCVAYWTSKRVMLVRTVGVIGKNCDVAARLHWRDDDAATVEVVVRADRFDSGNARRDRDVARILDAARNPEIRFGAGPIRAGEVRRLEAGNRVAVPGYLEVAGRRHAVEFAVRLQGDVVSGEARTTFAALGLEVDRVGPGGMVADPAEDLALLLHLHLDRVHGAERVTRPP